VSGDSLVEIAEEAENGELGTLRRRLLVQPVDQIDKFAVLMIDRFDADAISLLPMQQAHCILLSER
jgi:hypothetical protein